MTIICPGDNWKYQWNSNPATDEDTVDEEGNVIASLTNVDGYISFRAQFCNTDKCLLYYDLGAENAETSIVEDNVIVTNLVSSLSPSTFRYFSIYFEDVNGVVATYALNNEDIGKEFVNLLSALVCEKDFNKSFISKIGFMFYGRDALKENAESTPAKKFIFRLSDMHTVFRIRPSYVDPQEVIDFLGIRTNKGERLVLTDSTNPTYNTVAQRVLEAENYVESQTRTAWTEKRVKDEMQTFESFGRRAGGLNSMSVISMGFLMGSGMENYIKGYPVKLTHDRIQPIDYDKGDRVYIGYIGSKWIELTPGQFWADEAKGIIYIKSLIGFSDPAIPGVKITYRYGYGPAPADIRQAVILKTAMIIISTDWYRQLFPQSPMFDPMKQETVTTWTWTLKDILRGYTNYIAVGGI